MFMQGSLNAHRVSSKTNTKYIHYNKVPICSIFQFQLHVKVPAKMQFIIPKKNRPRNEICSNVSISVLLIFTVALTATVFKKTGILNWLLDRTHITE
jgi:hypothetical protein